MRLAVAPNGDVLLGWIEKAQEAGQPYGQDVHVARYAQGQWQHLGGALNYSRPREATTLDLAIDAQGRPLLAWNENLDHVDLHVVRSFQNGTWTDWDARRLGQDLTYAARVRRVASSAGEAVMVWGIQNTHMPGTLLVVQTWDGVTWRRSPPLNSGRQVALLPAIALNTAGAPVVTWLEGDAATSAVLVKRWTGTAWQALGGALNRRPNTYTFAPALRLDGAGRPVVAWLEDQDGIDTLFVKRWTGVAWQALGDALNVRTESPAGRPALALDAQGRVTVAWAEGLDGSRQVYAKRWDGKTWRGLGGGALSTSGRDAGFTDLGIGPDGRTYVAWQEQTAGGHVARVVELHSP
ncbi:hypothetical protein E7T06_05055 [Deinococcus sp. Arct2-2]|uniref:hypothetical protein n=1 Tax=Deinococcus sp. Arct2-2 TaxID=2568653 RepID=UPI0010A3095B|nr:hypothetical protein [Deinococcus sp. Arct2-2]THF70930.1 hypothetical protein E7T06_05055 [Deinococcus sp. Arct2-2]